MALNEFGNAFDVRYKLYVHQTIRGSESDMIVSIAESGEAFSIAEGSLMALIN